MKYQAEKKNGFNFSNKIVFNDNFHVNKISYMLSSHIAVVLMENSMTRIYSNISPIALDRFTNVQRRNFFASDRLLMPIRRVKRVNVPFVSRDTCKLYNREGCRRLSACGLTIDASFIVRRFSFSRDTTRNCTGRS